MSEATMILARITRGDPEAAQELLPLVYDELRKLAAVKLTNEKPGQTLQATALVHDAYIRLVDGNSVQRWDSRGHFFAAAAEAMRRILVDNAKRKNALKRGGDGKRIDMSAVEPAVSAPSDDIVALSDALDELAKLQPQTTELVKLRYFAGLTNQEAAELLGISPRKANSLWAYAKVWLHDFLAEDSTQ